MPTRPSANRPIASGRWRPTLGGRARANCWISPTSPSRDDNTHPISCIRLVTKARIRWCLRLATRLHLPEVLKKVIQNLVQLFEQFHFARVPPVLDLVHFRVGHPSDALYHCFDLVEKWTAGSRTALRQLVYGRLKIHVDKLL